MLMTSRPAGVLAFVMLVGALCGCAGQAPPPAAPAPSAAPSVAAPAATAPVPAAPTALPASEVPRGAIAAETRIRSVRSLVNRTREMDTIGASATPVFESIESLKDWMRTRDPRQQTARALRSLGLEWRLDGELLNGWMEATGARLDALTAARATLKETKDTWTGTEAALVREGAPPDIRERAHAVLASIAEVEDGLHAEIDKVLLLQSRTSAASLDVEDALDTIAGALREERKSLLKTDSPPIWKARQPPSSSQPLSTEISATLDENVRALRQYAARESRAFQLHIVLTLLVLIGFFRLRPRSHAWPASSKGVIAVARLVQRPILGACLVALLCGRWIHPRAPLALYELNSILLSLPVVVLMKGIVEPRVRGALYTLATLFVAERIWESTWAGTFLERIVLLGLTVLSAAAVVWTFRRSAPLPALVAPGWWRVLRGSSRLAVVALAVSLVSNVAGNVSLSRLLTATVVNVSYAGVVLYTAALLLRGTAELLIRSRELQVLHTVALHGDLILRRVSLAIDAAMMLSFVMVVLASADLLPLVKAALGELLVRRWGVGDFRFSFATALIFVATVYVSIVVSRAIRMVLEGDVYPRVQLPRGVPDTLTMLMRYGVISLGFLLALAVAGIPIDRLTVVFGALGVGIGFGLQSVVNNFVSGLIIMFERPIQIGDAVEVSGLSGRVRHIGVRASTIETFDGAEVIVPNGTLVSSHLINWTLTNRSRRIEIQVGVAYGTDPERVMTILTDAVKGESGVLADPAPFALFRAFGPSSLDFSLFLWTSDFDSWTRLKSDTTVRVNKALHDAGIDIPLPQQVVHLGGEASG